MTKEKLQSKIFLKKQKKVIYKLFSIKYDDEHNYYDNIFFRICQQQIQRISSIRNSRLDIYWSVIK